MQFVLAACRHLLDELNESNFSVYITLMCKESPVATTTHWLTVPRPYT